MQGLTLAEAKQEIDARYDAAMPGVHVTLVLVAAGAAICVRAGRSRPARPVRTGRPDDRDAGDRAGRRLADRRRTCGKSSSSAAAPDWRLMATMLDLRGALYGRRPVPADDIWLNDSDIVLVTKTPIQQVDEVIEQVFTRGLYSVVPREVIWNLDTVGSSL